MKDAGVSGYFSVIVCGDMVEKSKPEPEIYLKACEGLQVRPDECYVLEDSKSGILSGFKAGCKVIMVPDLWMPDDELLKIIYRKFNDLDEVKDFLAENRAKTGESIQG